MKYHVIYADPPWKYNSRLNPNTKFGGGAMGHYPVMSIEELKRMRIDEIAEENCALFLWATFPRLKEALEVIEAWGFEYKTLGFSWHKTNRVNKELFFGIGSYTKSNCEVCLFATRGKVGIKGSGDPKEKLIVQSHTISSALNAPKQRHSKKPDQIRERIEELFGQVSRIELFAREEKEKSGWDVYGNEVKSGDLSL